ncbi:MAG: hypothetical protein HQK65_20585 [Desulfamplus sp.]|nr:hypothetical protein [Desulfamplus sp.]
MQNFSSPEFVSSWWLVSLKAIDWITFNVVAIGWDEPKKPYMLCQVKALVLGSHRGLPLHI